MPMENYERNNFTTINLAPPIDQHGYEGEGRGSPRPDWVPKLDEIVRVLSTQYDKKNFAF